MVGKKCEKGGNGGLLQGESPGRRPPAVPAGKRAAPVSAAPPPGLRPACPLHAPALPPPSASPCKPAPWGAARFGSAETRRLRLRRPPCGRPGLRPSPPPAETEKARPRQGAGRNAALFGGVVIKVALNVDDGGALIAAAAGQVAQRTDEIGQVAGGGALAHHVAHQAAGVLFPDAAGHRLL